MDWGDCGLWEASNNACLVQAHLCHTKQENSILNFASKEVYAATAHPQDAKHKGMIKNVQQKKLFRWYSYIRRMIKKGQDKILFSCLSLFCFFWGGGYFCFYFYFFLVRNETSSRSINLELWKEMKIWPKRAGSTFHTSAGIWSHIQVVLRGFVRCDCSWCLSFGEIGVTNLPVCNCVQLSSGPSYFVWCTDISLRSNSKIQRFVADLISKRTTTHTWCNIPPISICHHTECFMIFEKSLRGPFQVIGTQAEPFN